MTERSESVLSHQPAPVAANASAEPALNWKLSDDAKERIAEIDDNRRNAMLNANNIVAGTSNASAEAREDMADWSDLPKDIYVVGARRVNAVGFDVQCCSVPMVTAPEVRYVRSDMIAVSETSTQSSANASAVLQNDLGEMLLALGMSDAAQPKSPHEVFQSAIVEMKRQLTNASAEARLREALGYVRAIIKDGAETGFNCYDGDWAERLFKSQAVTLKALSAHPHASDCDKQGER